jgi:hypothetical protein
MVLGDEGGFVLVEAPPHFIGDVVLILGQGPES